MTVKTIDTYFSKYIRLLHSVNGYCTCCTCGKTKKWDDIDAGHYVSRKYWLSRWDEYNVHPQCRGCNRDLSKYKASTLAEYTGFIIKNYGIEKYNELMNVKKKLNRKPRENEILEIGNKIKLKLKEVKNERIS